jgi:purine-binding chemotaxis protein CheW
VSAARARPTSREAILARRAEILAADDGERARRRLVTQVALVGVADQRIGIPVADVREIVPLPEITALPGLPPWLVGLAQVRGELIGVVDLAEVLGAGNARAHVMAVIEDPKGPVGLACTSVLGFRDIYEDELATDFAPRSDGPLRSMTRDLVAILDIGRLPLAPESPR